MFCQVSKWFKPVIINKACWWNMMTGCWMKQPYEMRFGKWGIRFEIGSLLLIFLLSQISFNANFVQLIWSETRNNQEKNQLEISFFRADVISDNPPLVAREKPSEWSCERPVIAKNVPVEPACRLNKPRDSIPRRALTPQPAPTPGVPRW